MLPFKKKKKLLLLFIWSYIRRGELGGLLHVFWKCKIAFACLSFAMLNTIGVCVCVPLGLMRTQCVGFPATWSLTDLTAWSIVKECDESASLSAWNRVTWGGEQKINPTQPYTQPADFHTGEYKNRNNCMYLCNLLRWFIETHIAGDFIWIPCWKWCCLPWWLKLYGYPC